MEIKSTSQPLPLPIQVAAELLHFVQFGALGVGCAGAAVLLYEGVRVSEVLLRPLPRIISAPLAGAVCGAIALRFPQVCYRFRSVFAVLCLCSFWCLHLLIMAKDPILRKALGVGKELHGFKTPAWTCLVVTHMHSCVSVRCIGVCTLQSIDNWRGCANSGHHARPLSPLRRMA